MNKTYRKSQRKTTTNLETPTRHLVSGLAVTVFVILLVIGVVVVILLDENGYNEIVFLPVLAGFTLVAFYLLFAIQVGQQWEKAVVLRLGKFRRLAGPGLFLVIPIIDTIPSWIDHRVMVTPFNAEKTLTRDNTELLLILSNLRSDCRF